MRPWDGSLHLQRAVDSSCVKRAGSLVIGGQGDRWVGEIRANIKDPF